MHVCRCMHGSVDGCGPHGIDLTTTTTKTHHPKTPHLYIHLFIYNSQVKIFNVGNYRRQLGLAGADKDFFDPKNAEVR